MEKPYSPKNCTVTQLLTEKPRRPFTRMKFKLVFRRDDRMVHEVEIKNINLQDLRRHLQSGESVNMFPNSQTIQQIMKRKTIPLGISFIYS